MKNSPSIVWFSNDLRLADNRALTAAAARGPVVPLYIFNRRELGAAANLGLQESLKILARDLDALGASLVLRRGNPLEILYEVAKESGARAVMWTRRYEPGLAASDDHIAETLQKDGIDVARYPGFLLFEPEKIHPQSSKVYKVFTPFSKACFAASAPTQPLPPPASLQGVKNIKSNNLKDWNLVPKNAKWPQGIKDVWPMGEKAAHDRLEDFIKTRLLHYKTARDCPDKDGTSSMSPYLHFGAISPRQIWHAIKHVEKKHSASTERYFLELLWREFSWHLLYHIPSLREEPLQKSFATFPWRKDIPGLKAWQKGCTGYPIVDAGMRQLWQTGWMHNRVRMIVASFLIKDLLIDWRQGMRWFEDTLIDADMANNTASWQWVAGCGADAAPYFRVFNPTRQSEKFDPKGDYIRRYVPELAGLEGKFIHQPDKAPLEVLKKAGITLGKTYPVPLVAHDAARMRALAALEKIRTRD